MQAIAHGVGSYENQPCIACRQPAPISARKEKQLLSLHPFAKRLGRRDAQMLEGRQRGHAPTGGALQIALLDQIRLDHVFCLLYTSDAADD